MYPIHDMTKISPLFDGWEETMIWSCLQGRHGRAWADDRAVPKSAQIITGDLCFLAGVPNLELASHIPDFASDSIQMVPSDESWTDIIEQAHGIRCERTLRYAIKKEPNVFDREKLQAFIDAIAPQYSLHLIDETLYEQALSVPWSKDLCSQFATYQDYKAYGLGVVALCDGVHVAGASSYTSYDKGIEIEVDTKEEYRRKGLALACSSKLILECLERGLYPSWDAHNLGSVALAEKLGYHLDHEYLAYDVQKA